MEQSTALPGGSVNRMRWILFWVTIGIYSVVTILTILALFTNLVQIPEQFSNSLFNIFIGEAGLAVLALFYSLFKLNPWEQSVLYTRLTDATEDMADFASKNLQKQRTRLRSKDKDISNLKGRWDAKWYLDGEEEPYVDDEIVIEEIVGNEVHGHGMDTKGTYDFEGLFLRGVLSLVYNYRNFPMAGVVVLKVGLRGRNAKGKWYGYLVEDRIDGGKVTWKKL